MKGRSSCQEGDRRRGSMATLSVTRARTGGGVVCGTHNSDKYSHRLHVVSSPSLCLCPSQKGAVTTFLLLLLWSTLR